MAAVVTCLAILLPVFFYFDFQRCQDHAAGPFTGQLIQCRDHLLVTPLRSFLRSDYRHHRRAFPRPASRHVRGIGYPERYTTFSTSFHNF